MLLITQKIDSAVRLSYLEQDKSPWVYCCKAAVAINISSRVTMILLQKPGNLMTVVTQERIGLETSIL